MGKTSWTWKISIHNCRLHKWPQTGRWKCTSISATKSVKILIRLHKDLKSLMTEHVDPLKGLRSCFDSFGVFLLHLPFKLYYFPFVLPTFKHVRILFEGWIPTMSPESVVCGWVGGHIVSASHLTFGLFKKYWDYFLKSNKFLFKLNNHQHCILGRKKNLSSN